MNVSHPDEFEESAKQESQAAEVKPSDQEPEQAATEAAPLMARSTSNPIIINK